MTDTHQKQDGRTPGLVEQMRTMAAMLGLGEKVSLAYEVELIETSATEIERLRADLAEVEAEIDNLEGEQCGYDTELLALQTRAESAETTTQEAAADIDRLRAKLAEAEAEVGKVISDNFKRAAEITSRAEAAEKRLAEARAVIEPFVRRAGKLDGHWREGDTNWSPAYGYTAITIGHLRAAAKWMEKNR
ncbi:hypothetical protein GN330_22945 [Nitratireductor sp. CAU 1489]|uniref:Uncharacterized protein n=1 Tax=Nitratireductor arenosus TaxID=2682096 RepID=A0A844QLF8_9HYPH|nr:hypothetical protein [Nitratireductor arenosus]MVB00108.1 hypothetical protein [Nitratireductor arenosus]